MHRLVSVVVLAGALAGCAGAPSHDLSNDLLGVSKSAFLRCSGAPQLSAPIAGGEEISFLVNQAGGLGPMSPAAMPVIAGCSGRAAFADDRLVRITFSGNPDVCEDVFAPCAPRHLSRSAQ